MRVERDAADNRENTRVDADSDAEDQDDDRRKQWTAADQAKRVAYVLEQAFDHRGWSVALTVELLDPVLRHEPAGPHAAEERAFDTVRDREGRFCLLGGLAQFEGHDRGFRDLLVAQRT